MAADVEELTPDPDDTDEWGYEWALEDEDDWPEWYGEDDDEDEA